MGYLLGKLLILLLVLLLIGITYQSISTTRDLKKYPPPGQLVDVGGYKLHLNCQGEGDFTVVMDHGLGGLSLVWSLVELEISKLTKVCTYDRAGYGWSDPSPYPRTSEQMVQELYTLLKKAGIEGPYLLVGHSLGGLNLRLFASQYSEDVAGLILVDAVPVNIYSRLPVFEKSMIRLNKLFSRLSFISRIGLLRLLIQLTGIKVAPEFIKQLPLNIQPMIMAKFLPQSFETGIAENRLMSNSAEQVKTTTLPADLPLIVLSHGVNMFTDFSKKEAEKAEVIWQELQAETAYLLQKSKLQIAQKSGHDIHIEQPKIVINAVKKMLDKLRHDKNNSLISCP